MKAVTDFVQHHMNDDTLRLILERNKYPEIDMSLVVNCIESRRTLKGKMQEWYDEPELIFPLKLSAEQCSSSATGRYKADLAERIADKRLWRIADLTGGLGVDSWYFSQKAEHVIYNEMQTVLCEAARHNFGILGASGIDVINSEVSKENLDSILDRDVDIAYLDPARRDSKGKKVFLIEDCTPDVLNLKEDIFKRVRHILIKLSPMADITMACERLGQKCREVHVVSAAGECKELLIWMDREWNDEYTVTASELHNDGSFTSFIFKLSEEKSAVPTYLSPEKTYIFEPGKALMKAGAFNLISERFRIAKLGRSTHYYITDNEVVALELKNYGKVYQILDCMPLDKRSIKHCAQKYPKAEITARNIPMDTEALRKKSGITSGDDAHIFGLKSDLEGNLLIAAKRIF